MRHSLGRVQAHLLRGNGHGLLLHLLRRADVKGHVEVDVLAV